MSPSQSITASPSFQARLLQAERWRITLMASCLALILALWELRALLHDEVARARGDRVPILILILSCIALLGLSHRELSARIRRGAPLTWPRLIASVVLDLGAPFGVLLILHLHSPLGGFEALSAPILLMAPIVIMLSVLRLRPLFSLGTGIAAALLHWALVAHALLLHEAPAHTGPLLFSYGVLLIVTGVAAMMLARFVRRSIIEAVEEAEAAQRADLALKTVEKELDIARDIQLGLLPTQAPDLESFDIAAMSRPATQAGGDYYDWQPLPDGRLIVAIADVTGHGIGPALVMAVCRAYARATAPGADNAADLLNRLNRLIVDDVKGARFITMAVALLSPDGEVEMLSAGHGPTFLYRGATRAVENFGGDGLPLGVLDEEEYQPVARLRLEPGDTLVLLTDGFMERAGRDGSMYGSERLERLISRHGAEPAAALIEALDRSNAEFADGAPQGDDMTAVVIRRKPLSRPPSPAAAATAGASTAAR